MNLLAALDPPDARDPSGRLGAAALALGAVALAGLVGALVGPRPGRPRTQSWYEALEKPPETPPAPVFGLVWPALEGLQAVAGYRLLRGGEGRGRALTLWAFNVAMIGGWSALFFGAKRLGASTAAAGAMAASGAAFVAQAAGVDRPAAAAGAPFALWVAFATLLTGRIAARN